MEQGGVVVGFFLPAGEKAASAVQPAEGAFDDPAAWSPARGGVGPILAASAQVELVAEAIRLLARHGVVVAFVQAQASRGLGRAAQREQAEGRFQ